MISVAPGWAWPARASAATYRSAIPSASSRPILYEPNPRQVSRDLLARRSFVPVPHLNVLVPAWLQFMVHDWLSHGGGDTTTPPHRLPLPPGDDWPPPDMTILHTLPDDRRGPADQGQPATYPQHRDALVGRLADLRLLDLAAAARGAHRSGHRPAARRTARFISTRAAIFRSIRTSDVPEPRASGVNGNWWVGLSVLHTLFAREHNAIVDRLRIEYPRPTANGCSRRRGSSTPRSSPRSTPSNGRRR